MAITPYSRPQETISQVLRKLDSTQASRRNPVVLGQQFMLVLNDGRDLVEYPFDTAGLTSEFQYYLDGLITDIDASTHVVDTASVKLYGKNLEAKLAEVSADLTLEANSVTGATIKFASSIKGGLSLLPALDGRAIAVGDLVRVACTIDNTVARTTEAYVVGFVGKDVNATQIGGDKVSVTGGAYTGATAKTIYFTKTSAGWDISSSDGTTTPSSIDVNTTTVEGVTVSLTATDVANGQYLTLSVTPKTHSNTEFDKIVLNTPVGGVITKTGVELDSLTVVAKYSGEINSTFTSNAAPAITTATVNGTQKFTVATGLVLPGTLKANAPAFEDEVGTLTVSYRAAVVSRVSDAPVAIRSLTDITNKLGEINVNNPIALGAYHAFTGAQGARTVYAVVTEADTVAAYTTALNKLRTSDVYYTLVPLTTDLSIIKLVTAHADEQSNKYNRNFRRVYAGTDNPGEYVMWGARADLTRRTAKLDGDVVTLSTSTIGAGDNFTDAGVNVGDKIKFDVLPTALVVVQVISEFAVRVSVSDAQTDIPESAFNLVKADTADNTAQYVIARSNALANRRCVNVWAPAGTYTAGDGTTVTLSNIFTAATIAGVRCVLLPQQGLTMQELDCITAVPQAYTRFTPEQLDEIAANGTMVITQEVPNGPVFIRHQLTTDSSNGILYYEDNVGVIADEFCYAEKDAFRGYIGKKNATALTQGQLRVELINLALSFTRTTPALAEYGPMITKFTDADGNENSVTVERVPNTYDRFQTYVKLSTTVPLNGLDHVVEIDVSYDL